LQRAIHDPPASSRTDGTVASLVPGTGKSQERTLVDARNDRHIVVHESKTMKLSDINLEQQTSDVTIDYDRTMEVPDIVRDDVSASSDIEGSHASYLFTLASDSLAQTSRPH